MFSFMNPGKSKPAKKGLKIIIVGCGKVGTTLVEQLSKEGHDIIIIDKNAKKVQEIANIYDIMGIVGNGASYSVQMDAGIEDTDLIISVTESDELNLLCCTVAKQAVSYTHLDVYKRQITGNDSSYQHCFRWL